MQAYTVKLGGTWAGFIQAPCKRYIEIRSYSESKETMEMYLKDLGYTVVSREVALGI